LIYSSISFWLTGHIYPSFSFVVSNHDILRILNVNLFHPAKKAFLNYLTKRNVWLYRFLQHLCYMYVMNLKVVFTSLITSEVNISSQIFPFLLVNYLSVSSLFVVWKLCILMQLYLLIFSLILNFTSCLIIPSSPKEREIILLFLVYLQLCFRTLIHP